MFKKYIFENLVYCFIFFLIQSSINPEILSQNKGKTTLLPDLNFKHLTTKDGLLQNYVNAIEQDKKGFMWFGTNSGLQKYDGYNFTQYTHNPFDTTTLSGNSVRKIFEDSRGLLWINIDGRAFDIMDPNTEVVMRKSFTTNGNLGSIAEDKKGNIWIGGGDVTTFPVRGRLFKISKESVSNFRFNPVSYYYDSKESLILDIMPDDDEILWIATMNGLIKLRPDIEEQPEYYRFNLMETSSYYPGMIRTIAEKNDSMLWLGCRSGLILFNKLTGSSILYKHGEPNWIEINNIVLDEADRIWTDKYVYAKSSDKYQRVLVKNFPEAVARVFKDRAGNIWMGSGYGLYVYFPESNRFKKFSNSKQTAEMHLSVRSFLEDSRKNLWFGTWNFIHSWDRATDKVRSYGNTVNLRLFGSTGASAIAEDRDGIIWFVSTGGLTGFDPYSNKIKYQFPDFSDMSLHGILIDKAGKIWIVTGRYLRNITDVASGLYVSYRFNQEPAQYGENWHAALYQDKEWNIWFTSNIGLVKFDQKSNRFTIYSNDPTDRSSISGNMVLSICPDPLEPMKKLWIGTNGGGLNLFNTRTETFTHIQEKDGLPNNVVYGILSDKEGNLWLSTNRGLSKYNPISKQFINYDVNDGLQHDEFNTGAYFKSESGEMFFGGIDGFNYFYPDGVANKDANVNLVFTDFRLFNKSISVRDSNDILKKVVTETKEITLSFNQNIFSFEFALLDYYAPEKNQFAYKLEGFNEDWIQLGTRREVMFTGLEPGEYLLKIKGTNSDGIWSENTASMKILITPPFWSSWWSYIFYVCFSLCLLYGIRRYELNRTRLKNQHKLDEIKLKEREENDRMKSRFYANISHEFRTPLTLILGPAEKLISEFNDEEIQKQTGIIKRNSNRLLDLINQLLDLSKSEAGRLELKASKANIVTFVQGITMSFESFADEKDIALKVNVEKEKIELYFDKEKMTKIMTNLLSNAFKFTQSGGKISISINEKDINSVMIKVRNTGQGIAKEELPKLFDRFYQVDSSQTREYEGSGIGLALTKDLVELHHGSISADSKLGEWTELTVTLPVGRKHLDDNQIVVSTTRTIVSNEKSKFLEFSPDKLVQKDLSLEAPAITYDVNGDRNIILVVEDNVEVREFIKESLSRDFQIEEASNGEQGVRKAEQIIPDLIISDIMMPKMDGNELTRILKNDEKTSHIPIVLLTAKSEQESKLEGLETGADEYLTKPFDTKELLIRIKNLINIRRKLQKKYSGGDFMLAKKESEGKLNNHDEQFMFKVLEVIENHISDEDFSIEQFGKEVGMSRTQLHRKLKALSGKSASNFLRSLRLSKAKKMILEKKGNISEIAYSVGFSSPQYFTRCFKEEFGFPPSDLLNN